MLCQVASLTCLPKRSICHLLLELHHQNYLQQQGKRRPRITWTPCSNICMKSWQHQLKDTYRHQHHQKRTPTMNHPKNHTWTLSQYTWAQCTCPERDIFLPTMMRHTQKWSHLQRPMINPWQIIWQLWRLLNQGTYHRHKRRANIWNLLLLPMKSPSQIIWLLCMDPKKAIFLLPHWITWSHPRKIIKIQYRITWLPCRLPPKTICPPNPALVFYQNWPATCHLFQLTWHPCYHPRLNMDPPIMMKWNHLPRITFLLLVMMFSWSLHQVNT